MFDLVSDDDSSTDIPVELMIRWSDMLVCGLLRHKGQHLDVLRHQDRFTKYSKLILVQKAEPYEN